MNPPYRQIQAEELNGLGDPVIVCTFMRSGTHLTLDLLRRQFAAFQSWKRPFESLDSLYLPVDILLPGWAPQDWSVKRVRDVLGRARRPILKAHFLDPSLANLRETQPAVADWLEARGTFLHVTRDPRQVLPSLWAFLPDWQGIDPGPFDAAFIEQWLPRLLEHRLRWSRRIGAKALAYEALIQNPEATIRDLGAWLREEPLWRQPFLPPPLRSRWESRMMRLLARHSASTAILSTRRSPTWDPAWDGLLLGSVTSCPESSN